MGPGGQKVFIIVVIIRDAAETKRKTGESTRCQLNLEKRNLVFGCMHTYRHVGTRATYMRTCACMRRHKGMYTYTHDHALILVHGARTSISVGTSTSVGMGTSTSVVIGASKGASAGVSTCMSAGASVSVCVRAGMSSSVGMSMGTRVSAGECARVWARACAWAWARA